ncbi:MAG TPA: glycosyltransferase [Dongiaceae bacterium]|nr:glycosyltransferase [Dongiaceae bacterium]
MGGLRAGGDEVRLYTCVAAGIDAPRRHSDVIQHFYRLSAITPLSRLPAPLSRWCKGLDHAASMRRLVGELMAWRPSVIHFQWTPIPILDRWFLQDLRTIAPIVCTVHDTTPFNGSPSSWLQRIGALEILAKFDAVVVHTDHAYERLKDPNLRIKEICKIPHGLLEGPAADTPRRPAVPSTSVNILAFGKIKPYKGLDVLLHALSLLSPEDRKRCCVKVVGKPYMDTRLLTRLAASLGLNDIVEFDFRYIEDDQISGLFQSASVVVLPYRNIDASGVLFTAIALGCPVIATRIGGFAETLSDGCEALLVPPNNPHALSLAIHRVIQDCSLRSRLAEGVRNLRYKTLSWEEIGQLTHRLYERARARQ